MEKQLSNLGIPCLFYGGVPHSDPRIGEKPLNAFCRRQWSITYGHLDILQSFYHDSTKQFAVICEDDICIHDDFHAVFKKVVNDFKILRLDLLLLSYLLPYKLDAHGTYASFTLKVHMPRDAVFKYHNYPSYVYGTQMYIVTKNGARDLLSRYYENFAGIRDNHFVFDKLLMSLNNRAIIYPMLALEDKGLQDDPYHLLCQKVHEGAN